MTVVYYPEGNLIDSEENYKYTSTEMNLIDAIESDIVLEAYAVRCDAERNLHVNLPCMAGIIPYHEGAVGIADGKVRDIALLSRVSKAVSFTVIGIETLENGKKRAILSRKRAQKLCMKYYIDNLELGDVIPARITRLETFGAFCDIGCGLPALIPIASLSVSRISHPSDRFSVGDDIFAIVSSLEDDRICLSHKELLGTWQENVDKFTARETVTGIVRSVENYGIFIELAPNLAGLAEPREGIEVGVRAGVYIKSIIPEKMKIKLVIIDTSDQVKVPTYPDYFITEGQIKHWKYSPDDCEKSIETNFT